MHITRDFTAELTALNTFFNTVFGIISRIDGNTYTVIQLASELDVINVGDEFVTEDTYCKAVVDTNDIVQYDQVSSIESMLLHPVYTAMQLEAYIGHPIRYKGRVIGTLNFSGFEPKTPPFSEADRQQVRELAQQIELCITA